MTYFVITGQISAFIFIFLLQNAAKFVVKGFVRLRAEIGEDGMVTLYVEDSGPGVPAAKQKALFKKFQESLDVLSQGTVSHLIEM